MLYITVDTVRAEGSRSPVVFVHGFPDSPLMFADYVTPDEQQQAWLHERPIHRIALPNRHTHPHFPSVGEMARRVLRHQFREVMDDLAANSPTGQVIPIVHDWGATFMWRYIREQPTPPIERMVSLSVGSSFRYDVWTHGIGAATWLYTLLFSLPYYLPFMRKPIAKAIVQQAGYQSDTAHDLYKDAYHYWDGPLRALTAPFWLLGVGRTPAFTAFDFPVLYIRTPLDFIASTPAFEEALRTRPDCTFHLWEDTNHWFPEQQSERVLREIRQFMA